jgi:hypothetical protein
MMISRIGERKRENNLLLLRQESCKRASGKTPINGSLAVLDVLALDLNRRIINAVEYRWRHSPTFSNVLLLLFSIPMRPKASFGEMFGLGFHRQAGV